MELPLYVSRVTSASSKREHGSWANSRFQREHNIIHPSTEWELAIRSQQAAGRACRMHDSMSTTISGYVCPLSTMDAAHTATFPA